MCTTSVLGVAAFLLHCPTLPKKMKASNKLKNGANTSNTRFQRVEYKVSSSSLFLTPIARLSKSQETERKGAIYSVVFPTPSRHTHHAFQDSLTRNTQVFCRCHLAGLGFKEQRCIEWSSGTDLMIEWPATLRSSTKRCCGRKALYALKSSTMQIVEEMFFLILIYYWLRPDTKMTWSSKPNRSERTKNLNIFPNFPRNILSNGLQSSVLSRSLQRCKKLTSSFSKIFICLQQCVKRKNEAVECHWIDTLMDQLD